MSETIEQRLDEILLKHGTHAAQEVFEQQGYGTNKMPEYGHNKAKKNILQLLNETRIDAIYSMHDSIMRGELQWGDIREDAWLNGTIHKWIDRVIESGDTTSTSHNGIWIQNQLTPKENNQ